MSFAGWVTHDFHLKLQADVKLVQEKLDQNSVKLAFRVKLETLVHEHLSLSNFNVDISMAVEFFCCFITILWDHSAHNFEKSHISFELNKNLQWFGIHIERAFPLRLRREIQLDGSVNMLKRKGEGIWVGGIGRYLSIWYVLFHCARNYWSETICRSTECCEFSAERFEKGRSSTAANSANRNPRLIM